MRVVGFFPVPSIEGKGGEDADKEVRGIRKFGGGDAGASLWRRLPEKNRTY